MLGRIFTALLLSLPLIGAYGIFAIGIVLIYRASKMLNLAHGAMAMVPAFLIYALVKAGIPMPAALTIAIAGGAALGVAVEKVFVSRLRQDGPTAQTVGTVAALGILVALAARIFGTASLPPVKIFPEGRIDISLSSIQVGEIGLFFVMLVVSAILFVLIQKTDLGLKMRGTAESRLAASLMGVNPNKITSFTWALGGALAALAGILLAAVTTLHPYTLAFQVLPAFIAALLGGLGSLPGALLGATIVGATQGLVPVMGSVGQLQGAPQLFLAALAIIVMATRGKTLTGADQEGTTDAKAASKPRTRQRSTRRRALALLALAAILAFPFTSVPSSVVGAANLAASYSVIAVSVVLLTGWVGQISLGHAALVGIGAYVTGHVVTLLGIPFPWSIPFAAAAAGAAAALLGAVALRVRGLYLAVATLVFSWMASEFLFRQPWFIKNAQIPDRPIGFKGTLPYFDFTDRRTFYLVAWATVALVIFAVANLRDSKTGRAFFALRGSEMAAASLGIDVMRYKLIAFAASGAIAGMAGNLIMSDARSVTADQFTFNISLFFLAIAVVGGIGSLPGAVASGLLFAALTEVFFRVQFLGRFLEMISSVLLAATLLSYRGGLASVPSKLKVALTPVMIKTLSPVLRLVTSVRRLIPTRPRKVPRVAAARPIRPKPVSSLRRASLIPRLKVLSLALSKMSIPIPFLTRSSSKRSSQPKASRASVSKPNFKAEPPLDFQAALRAAVPQEEQPLPQPQEPNGHQQRELLELARAEMAKITPNGDRYQRRPLIQAEHVIVRFGGLTAVNDASLEVREGEIVGLIGPNGAGKTTLFNAIAGYNSPTAGVIKLYETDVTELSVHKRAQVGVARTFQQIQLFSQLSVYQNLLVATHVHNPTGFVSHMAVSYRSLVQERVAKQRVLEILELLDLEHLKDRTTADLSFGTLRMVEVARALVTGFRVIMLDEPASGLDHNETDHLMEVLRFVRGLGVTLLLIEHDVRMVTGVSDYMYVLDQGQMIAQGPPEDIQRDPKVIAAYLGEPEKELVS